MHSVHGMHGTEHCNFQAIHALYFFCTDGPRSGWWPSGLERGKQDLAIRRTLIRIFIKAFQRFEHEN